jgi:acylphosphatase
VSLPSKAAAIRLQLEAETYGIEFNDHYLRNNGDGSVTVSVFGTEEQVEELADAGYEIGVTIEGPNTWHKQVEAPADRDPQGDAGSRRGDGQAHAVRGA